jgi:TupA-like ATPgrasp
MSSFLSSLKLTINKSLIFLQANYKNPIKIIAKILSLYPISFLIPDRPYLYIMYRANTGLPLNLKDPKRFNEKTQWLKLNDRKDWYSKIADKIEVRDYVAARIGEQYLIPVIAEYQSVDDIDFDKLPNQFVLKCTHDSGTTVVCPDKSKLDIAEAKSFLRKRMSKNYYYLHREFCYKNIKPRIVCEKFMSADGDSVPTDYKFFCFHGVPKLIQVDTDRFTDHGRLTLLPNWEKAPFDIDRKYLLPDLAIKKPVERPKNLEEMLEISSKLSQDFKFIRVDLYSVNEKIYFGELTFYQGSGYDPIYPDEYNFWMGELIDLKK